jgi:hypothetical protein
MLLEFRAADRLRGTNGALTPLMDALLRTTVEDAALDLSTLRIVCDWIQYRSNFRETVEVRPVVGGTRADALEIGVDLRRALAKDGQPAAQIANALERYHRGTAGRIYLEPWCLASRSCIWDFNSLYWRDLGLWEEVSGQGYERALPGGESDARNSAAARESILELFKTWDHLAERRALPDQLHVLELGVGNGNQARAWLDEFLRVDREQGRDYYRRLHYLMGDYSPHLLDIARRTIGTHAEHVSALVLDALQPSKTLGFLKYKAFFVYISNVYDNLPTDELARIDGRLFQVEARAYLAAEAAGPIAAGIGVSPQELPELIRRLLRLGPSLLAETFADRFATPHDAVRFWQEVWRCVGLEERYTPVVPAETLDAAPSVSNDIMRSVVETHGDIRMHVSNGAATSFIDTLPLLHPHGMLQCHDLFVTDTAQYASGYRGPGKYDGSVVNWVNGAVLAAFGGRYGFEVTFEPFRHRAGSNITTMLARVRE